MQRWVLILLIALLGACGGGEAETVTTVGDLGPAEVVSAWLDAVAGQDVAAIESLVEPVGLAVVAAVENNLRSDELAGLLDGGMGEELATEYWSSFRDGFDAIQGESVS